VSITSLELSIVSISEEKIGQMKSPFQLVVIKELLQQKFQEPKKGLPSLLKKRGPSPRPWTWMDLTLSDRRRKEKGSFITRKKPPPLFLPSFHYCPFCFSFCFFWYIMFSII
jgi:hypothetical protein